MCLYMYIHVQLIHVRTNTYTLQAQAFKEDFEQERKDRETTRGRLATAEQTFTDRIEQLEAQLIQTRNDCQAELTARDGVHQTQVDKLRATIGQKDGELARANIHRQRLQEELQSSTQQVRYVGTVSNCILYC